MPGTTSHPLILLAEDSEDDAFFFRWTLGKSGLPCELIHVWDGEEALRVLERSRNGDGRAPDIVFLDLKMPALSGFEVLEWLRRHPFDPPLDVTVLSGSEHGTDVERARGLGASAYFTKPISPDHLRARVEAWRAAGAGCRPPCAAPSA